MNIYKGKMQKGFTLIELLVVIAIIGILAGILFAAINPADKVSKTSDTKLKSQINSVRSHVATTFFESDPNGYASVQTDPKVLLLLNGLTNASVTSAQSGWAVKAQLENGNYYCRDSSGTISEAATQDITDYQCD